MFCIECGQPMADEAKFCAYCGTRRAVPVVSREAVAPPPQMPEPPSIAPPPAPVRPIRSTAEIMPIRVQRPTVPPPPMEPQPVEPEPVEQVESVVPWPAEEPEPPLYAPPSTGRPSAPAYVAAPPATAANSAERYAAVPFAATPGAHDVEGERKRISPVLIGAVLVALIAIAGIVWMMRSSMSFGAKAPANVTITIYPTSAKVVQGKGVDFVSEVSGAPSSEVTWSVEEGDSAGTVTSRGASAKGDTISLYCTYTAPLKPGTYHLVATSTADKSKSATAEITVAGK
jgi:zinc-ribbon domain